MNKRPVSPGGKRHGELEAIHHDHHAEMDKREWPDTASFLFSNWRVFRFKECRIQKSDKLGGHKENLNG